MRKKPSWISIILPTSECYEDIRSILTKYSLDQYVEPSFVFEQAMWAWILDSHVVSPLAFLTDQVGWALMGATTVSSANADTIADVDESIVFATADVCWIAHEYINECVQMLNIHPHGLVVYSFKQWLGRDMVLSVEFL